MKIKAFIGMVGAVGLCACQPSPQATTVVGRLADMGNDTLLVAFYAVNDIARDQIGRDTVVMQQGEFTFRVANDSVPTECYFYLKPKAGVVPSLRKQIGVVAFPGETVTVEGTMDDYRVTGNAFHAAYQAAKEQFKPYRKEVDAITQTIMRLNDEKKLTPELSDSLRALYMPAVNQLRKAQEEYIRQHPDEDVSVYLLPSMGSKATEELLSVIGDKARHGSMASLYQALEDAFDRMKERQAAQNKIVEGAEAPDFTLKDINGNDLALSSLRGKYVVLDFWGSWCGWCIKGVPDMKKYYAKYKDRMEILGIDCRDTEEKWKEAVKKHELPWLHVRNEENPDVSMLYGIQGFPTKIVVDPTGKIAKVVVGEDPAFYQYLDELFK